jgi:predicted transcriptional regulator
MAPVPTSYLISDEAKRLLKLLAAKHDRSLSKMIETLIKEAAKKQGVK